MEFSCGRRVELLVSRVLCVLRYFCGWGLGGAFAPMEGVCVYSVGLGGRGCLLISVK